MDRRSALGRLAGGIAAVFAAPKLLTEPETTAPIFAPGSIEPYTNIPELADRARGTWRIEHMADLILWNGKVYKSRRDLSPNDPEVRRLRAIRSLVQFNGLPAGFRHVDWIARVPRDGGHGIVMIVMSSVGKRYIVEVMDDRNRSPMVGTAPTMWRQMQRSIRQTV